eukprot:SAG31_NODE_1473_length_8207_cov_2.716330_3_plen_954_part_00
MLSQYRVLPLHNRERNRELVSLWVNSRGTSCTRLLGDLYKIIKHSFILLFLLSTWCCKTSTGGWCCCNCTCSGHGCTRKRGPQKGSINLYYIRSHMQFIRGGVVDAWHNVLRAVWAPETVNRVSVNRIFELHGPEQAVCWAFRAHVETFLTTMTVVIVVYKTIVSFFEDSQESKVFWDDTIVGFYLCAIWAPYTLNQWKWVEANMLHDWRVSESLLTDAKDPWYRQTIIQAVSAENYEEFGDVSSDGDQARKVLHRASSKSSRSLLVRQDSEDCEWSVEMKKRAWKLKRRADGLRDAAQTHTDSRVARLYSDVLAMMSEIDNFQDISHISVCSEQPCQCSILHDKNALESLVQDELKGEAENRDQLRTSSSLIVRPSFTLPDHIISVIEVVMVILFCLSLATLNGFLLYMEYLWYNILPLCESRFFVEFWSRHVKEYMGFLNNPTCFGGLGLDPWEVDNIEAGDPPWMWRGLIIFILDLINAVSVDVIYTDLMGVNLAEFLVWLRNYRLKEEKEARLVVLRFYFEIIGYFAIYITLAFAIIPFGQEINAALYTFLSPDEANRIVSMNISAGIVNSSVVWENVTAPAHEFFRVWTATRAPMAQLKARMVPLFIITALIANIFRVVIPTLMMLRRRKKTVGCARCCSSCCCSCCTQRSAICPTIKSSCGCSKTKLPYVERWATKKDCLIMLARRDKSLQLDKETHQLAGQVCDYLERDAVKADTRSGYVVRVRVIACKNLQLHKGNSGVFVQVIGGPIVHETKQKKSKAAARTKRTACGTGENPSWNGNNVFMFDIPTLQHQILGNAHILSLQVCQPLRRGKFRVIGQCELDWKDHLDKDDQLDSDHWTFPLQGPTDNTVSSQKQDASFGTIEVRVETAGEEAIHKQTKPERRGKQEPQRTCSGQTDAKNIYWFTVNGRTIRDSAPISMFDDATSNRWVTLACDRNAKFFATFAL